MEVANPRRILAVSLAESQDHLSTVIKELTGAYPVASPGTGALAGTTQELALDTPYYTARVPVWLDLIGAADEAEDAKDAANGKNGKTDTADDDDTNDPSSATPQQWVDAFLAEEAREVRAALGGVVVVLEVDNEAGAALDRQRDLVEHVGRLVRDGLATATTMGHENQGDGDGDMYGGYDETWDGVGLVVGVAPRGTGPPPDEDTLGDWEDACALAGLEFVLVAPGQAATNEYGEKTGVARVLEALQANDWQQTGLEEDDLEAFGVFETPGRGLAERGDEDDDDDDNFDPNSLDFGYDQSDFAGLREAIWRQGQQTVEDEDEGAGKGEGKSETAGAPAGQASDNDIQAVESMMQKLLAARDLGAGLPPEQRRRLAARTVGEVMRTL